MTEDLRCNKLTTAELTSDRLRDKFSGRNVRVKGNAKVMCHLIFGLLALTVDQLMRIII